ncbi:hypothetical protein FRZ44_01280 [Hypericibacter terrae]|uniref:Uncharacterized protein n=1 Tax=Hypericibacter terrae TaxID=2602015 RepID=A0A5J6MC71_9PROT|nr:hypothetical protein FRZ44_01280 [Hypericibacter terrae]
MLLHEGQQQVSLLHAIVPLSFEQALGAAEPPGRWTRLTSKEKTKTYPERATGPAHAFVCINVGVMGTIERPHIIVFAANQIGGHCKQFEILDSQPNCKVGAFERVVCIGPGPPFVMLSAPFEVIESFRGAAAQWALIGAAHTLRSGGSSADWQRIQHSCINWAWR